jgi:hypothetical protein
MPRPNASDVALRSTIDDVESAPVHADGPSVPLRASGGAGLEAAAPPVLSKEPDWMPRIWNGCNFAVWLKLLARNRFAVHPSHWFFAAIITVFTLLNSLLELIEGAIFGRAVRATRIDAPPIFLIGHWRSGTTLLHELMTCDENFGFPTTYQCMEPNHFLLTEWLLARWLRFLIPATRPMDNMQAAFDRPQEDEFAICLMGAESPYSALAFPNRAPAHLELEPESPQSLDHWKWAFHRFLQKITYKAGRRLVLKSPPHTARVKTLKEMFPDAIFIHIVRDPHVVFSSTVNLWRTLFKTYGLQAPTYDGLEEIVLNTFVHMHEKLDEGKAALEPGQFYQLRYEDLVKNPVDEIRKIYDRFRLPGFDACLPRLQSYLATVENYETNRYNLSPEQRAMIAARWGEVIRRYGYDRSL